MRKSLANTVRPLLLASCGLLAGCISLPIPEQGEGVLEPASVEQLKVGSSNRTDVLLTLGRAHRRGTDDRVLEYQWKAMVGVWAVGISFNCCMAGVMRDRRLCLEFDEKGILLAKQLLLQGDRPGQGNSCSPDNPPEK